MIRTALFLPALLSCALAAEPRTPNSKPQTPDSGGSPPEYPLKTCIVSDEPLPSDYVTYTHKEPGKRDITIRLCCEGCIEDFRVNPAKFLKKLEAAKAAARPKAL